MTEHKDHIRQDAHGRLFLVLRGDANSIAERKVRDGDDALYPDLFRAFRGEASGGADQAPVGGEKAVAVVRKVGRRAAKAAAKAPAREAKK